MRAAIRLTAALLAERYRRALGHFDVMAQDRRPA
jgi:hypothetical protein